MNAAGTTTDIRVARRRTFAAAGRPLALPPGRLTLLLGGAVVLIAVVSLCVGATQTSPTQVLAILASAAGIDLSVPFSSQQASLVWGIRLPRLLLGLAVGAGLAISGAVLQSMFRNPLADPGLIGVSTGSAFAISATIVVGERLFPAALMPGKIFILPFTAFLGGILATMLVYRIGKKKIGSSVAVMLLAGVAVNAFAVAGIGLMSFIATDAQLRNIMFWNLGSLAGATWTNVAMTVPLVLFAVVLMTTLARKLNVLLLGESEAGHLGVNVDRIRWQIIALAALAVGASVAVSGAIGFVGLIVPHLLRLSTGVDHRHLLINSAILGGLLLAFGDILTRTVLAPSELPIGIVTALVGGPFFVWLLLKKNV